jgi:hypothetical protein
MTYWKSSYSIGYKLSSEGVKAKPQELGCSGFVLAQLVIVI